MIGALTDPDRRRSSQLMLRRIRPVDADDRPIAALTRELSRDHERVDVPTLLLWGRNDDTLTLATARKLNAEIPNSRLQIVEEAKHSVHQEQPFATVAAIREFVDSLEAGLPDAPAPKAP
jgi:pimeloyl-ACP methyl ester carboxylesterase